MEPLTGAITKLKNDSCANNVTLAAAADSVPGGTIHGNRADPSKGRGTFAASGTGQGILFESATAPTAVGMNGQRTDQNPQRN